MRVAHSTFGTAAFYSGAALVLAFAGVLGLALADGGYDPVIRNPIGILVWWCLGLGLLFGVLPLARPSGFAVAAGVTLVAFVSWMALGLIWTESVDGTMADVGRAAVVTGFFFLAVGLSATNGRPVVVDGVAAAIGAVCLLALGSRFFPDLFSGSGDTALLVEASEGRLSFPIDYWNGLAALAAVGIAPTLALATEKGSRLIRSIAAAFIPVLALTVFLTYSRTGILACILAMFIFLALAKRPVQRLATLALGVVGAAVLIGVVGPRPEVADGVINAGISGLADGTSLVVTLIVTIAVGIAQWFLIRFDERLGKYSWEPDRRRLAIGSLVALGLLLVAFFAASGPAKVSDAWHEFESPGAVQESGASRLSSFGGNNRVQYWRSTLHQLESEPVHGRGSGTFELWSNRSEDTKGFVRDAHSWYLETLGELGAVGGLILLTFVVLLLVGGFIQVLRAPPQIRGRAAAALAGVVAFLATAALDWTWELAVVPAAAVLLAGALLAPARSKSGELVSRPFPPVARYVTAAIAVLAIVAIWLPYTTSYLMEESRDAASRGDRQTAYQAAVRASEIPPKGMAPLLQQALLLRENGESVIALEKATEATKAEPTNWRPWFVRSYLQAQLGLEAESRESFEEARSLNPHSSLLVNGYPGDR